MDALPTLIDTDGGIDDAVAIALAEALPALRVAAVTTVHGNVDVARATRNARAVLARVGARTGVVAGASTPLMRPSPPPRMVHGAEGLGYAEPSGRLVHEADAAAECIVHAARAHVGRGHMLALCCLGPLTNLARALERDPVLPRLLDLVVIAGGSIDGHGSDGRRSEFNWWADPEAVDAVLRSGLEIRLVPLDVSRQIMVPLRDIRLLAAAGERDADARFWGEVLTYRAESSGSAAVGCTVNDALAVALLADPTLATWRTARVSVGLGEGDERGVLMTDTPGGAIVRVAEDVRATDVVMRIERYVFGRWLRAAKPDGLLRGRPDDAAEADV